VGYLSFLLCSIRKKICQVIQKQPLSDILSRMSDSKYYVTIGLEVHAELKTKTKMFSAAPNNPDEKTPNLNIDPVSMAHPGTLPVINKKAVESVIRVGLALGADIANFTEFDRKNYFYPDIPKGYQISQYKYPIVSGGSLAGVDVTRVHLEEDTATSKHDKGDYSLVDFNRAGVPLMELVTEPVIHDVETIGVFARELQTLLRYLGVSDANMEKGEMRVEVNLSISPDKDVLGTKVEVKNIASFKMAEKAAAYEIVRHTKLWEEGRKDEIVQETRGWDDINGVTKSQRSKENSAEYRYFPDPDLPKLYLHDMFDLEALKSGLPELPADKRDRYETDFGIKAEDIESYILDMKLGGFFEEVMTSLGDNSLAKLASNYTTTDIVGQMVNDTSLEYPEVDLFSKLLKMVNSGDIGSRGAKDLLLRYMKGETKDPQDLAEAEGLIQKNDPDAVRKIAEQVIADNQKAADDFKAGNENSIKFLMGQVMKLSKGSANPKMAEDLIKELLS
jgi:aspartyl-tRNA(Asn)/glutamyl-tRNA(Gln) amidotransferase subunit B